MTLETVDTLARPPRGSGWQNIRVYLSRLRAGGTNTKIQKLVKAIVVKEPA